MVGMETRLREQSAEVQKKLDAIEAAAAARTGDAAGIFTTEESEEYGRLVEQAKRIKTDLTALQDRTKTELDDWLRRQDSSAATFPDNAVIQVDPNRKGVFSSLGEQIRAMRDAKFSGRIDERLALTMPPGGSANVGADGGFLIEEQFMPGIMAHAQQVGILWPRCTNVPIGPNSDRLEFKEWDDYDQSAGTVFGGVQGYWRAEAEAVTAKKPAMSDGEIKLNEWMGLARLSGRQIEDAPSMTALYEEAFGVAISKALDRAVYNGNGVGKPLGIMNSGALVTVAKESGQAADTIVAENILNMWSHVPAANRGSANLVWLVCVEADPQLSSMQIGTGASGQLVYMPAGGLSGQSYGTIYGRPVIAFDGCKKLGDLGDIVLCDLSEYITITKGGARSAWSMHVYFTTDEMAFRILFRCGGQPKYKKAITPENATSGFKLSPFVTLAAR